MSDKYYIYFTGWWNGFFNKSDKCNISFFEKLFSYTKIKNFEITNDLSKANILFQNGKRLLFLIQNQLCLFTKIMI